MTPFELAEPRSLREAIGLLDPDDPSVRPVAGGTALMLMMKSGVFRPTRLVSLRRIEKKFSGVQDGANGELKIGAMTPLSLVERTQMVRRHAPVITETLRTLSNVRVRNVATIGGHLAHGDPHMDLPPVLIALGAYVTVTGPSGERKIPVERLFAGYFETVLARNELITELTVPAQKTRRACYLKVTTRAAHDWPALGVAVSVDGDNKSIRDARIVISAATEQPTLLAGAEAAARGGRLDDALLRRIGDAAAEEAQVVDDAHGSAAYRKQLVRVYVGRALRKALQESTH
jgi:aerobic carbon-monoxide dehydrogenase medium subunit